VLSIQDVYPESLITLKKLSPGTLFAQLLNCLDASIARAASAVVVISDSAKEIYERGRKISTQNIHCIANWRSPENQPTVEMAQRQREMLGIEPGVFLIIFAGNVAAAWGIEDVISAVSRLGDEPPARLVIAGSGSALESCRRVASLHQSRRVHFNGPFQASEALAILGAGDILVLPTQGDQSLVSMPSKLISYMMSGRPILAIARGKSDLASVVTRAGCGWVIEPGDSEALTYQLGAASAMERVELTRMGSLGREYALAHFSTEVSLPKLATVVERAGGG
jgi:glycosyltransferase involved in cell wall biosynthesis